MLNTVKQRKGGRQKINLPVAAEDIFKRYETGEQLPDIAQSLGMSERTLYRRLLEHPDQWRIAQEAQAAQRHDLWKAKHAESVNNIEALKRQLDEEGITDAAARNWRLAHVEAIEKACERMVKRAEWELERLSSRLYGQKQEVSNAGAVSININLRSSDQVTIDGAATHIPQSSIGHNQGDPEKS